MSFLTEPAWHLTAVWAPVSSVEACSLVLSRFLYGMNPKYAVSSVTGSYSLLPVSVLDQGQWHAFFGEPPANKSEEESLRTDAEIFGSTLVTLGRSIIHSLSVAPCKDLVLELDLRPAQQERNHEWYWNPSSLPRTSEVIKLGGECKTTNLLYRHNNLTML